MVKQTNRIMKQHALSFAGFAFMSARELAPKLKPKDKRPRVDIFDLELMRFQQDHSEIRMRLNRD